MTPSPIPAPASSTVSPPKPTPYRSKKKLRMDSHYFNSSLPLPSPITPRPKKPEVEITLPSTEYTTNSPDWFLHVFGIEADGPTQASSAPYGGKIFSGRPKHYDASSHIKKVPKNLRGFSELYEIAVGDEVYAADADAGNFLKNLATPLSPPVGVVSKVKKASMASMEKKNKKRSLPMEFTSKEDEQRSQARARIEENWVFGRVLAKKHVLSLSANPAAMEKWKKAGRVMGVEEHGNENIHEQQQQQKNGIGALVRDKKLYDTRGKKSSFLYLQVDVVMPHLVDLE